MQIYHIQKLENSALILSYCIDANFVILSTFLYSYRFYLIVPYVMSCLYLISNKNWEVIHIAIREIINCQICI
jgi:hypothetical protein